MGGKIPEQEEISDKDTKDSAINREEELHDPDIGDDDGDLELDLTGVIGM